MNILIRYKIELRTSSSLFFILLSALSVIAARESFQIHILIIYLISAFCLLFLDPKSNKLITSLHCIMTIEELSLDLYRQREGRVCGVGPLSGGSHQPHCGGEGLWGALVLRQHQQQLQGDQSHLPLPVHLLPVPDCAVQRGLQPSPLPALRPGPEPLLRPGQLAPRHPGHQTTAQAQHQHHLPQT